MRRRLREMEVEVGKTKGGKGKQQCLNLYV
jgi:hypothetical protein